MLAPFLALTRKDLKLFFRNRRALLMNLAAPIAIGSFFGYIFGGAPTEPSRIPVLAVDQDGSTASRGRTRRGRPTRPPAGRRRAPA